MASLKDTRVHSQNMKYLIGHFMAIYLKLHTKIQCLKKQAILGIVTFLQVVGCGARSITQTRSRHLQWLPMAYFIICLRVIVLKVVGVILECWIFPNVCKSSGNSDLCLLRSAFKRPSASTNSRLQRSIYRARSGPALYCGVFKSLPHRSLLEVSAVAPSEQNTVIFHFAL